MITPILLTVSFSHHWLPTSKDFLTVNALLTIVLSLFSMTDVIAFQPYHKILRGPRFWVNLVFLLYWTITYFLWTLMAYHRLNAEKIPNLLLVSVFIMNTLACLSLTVIFFNYPKTKADAS